MNMPEFSDQTASASQKCGLPTDSCGEIEQQHRRWYYFPNLPGTFTPLSNPDYETKKAHFNGLLTLFGRKPVLEALRDETIVPTRLHLATSNKPSAELAEMQKIARRRQVEIIEHSRETLSRISRNGRQDQGVAVDIRVPGYRAAELLFEEPAGGQLIAVDGVTNPQNLGMIIRAVAASPTRGLLLARKGNARIDGLVIKASAGTLFKGQIYHCDDLRDTLVALSGHGYQVAAMDAGADRDLGSISPDAPFVFVLGNESTGISSKVLAVCDVRLSIPLANGVESLNVGVAAGLVAFRSVLT